MSHRSMAVVATKLFFALLFSTSVRTAAREQNPLPDYPSEQNPMPDYPPEWSLSPSCLNDYPVKNIGGHDVIVINPWVYKERLGLYKIIVSETRDFFASWGFNNSGNILWGLPLQFGWQRTSGRLRSTTTNQKQTSSTPEVIYPYSWWADMNYYLSVIPFLGALKSGILDPVSHPVMIQKPLNTSEKFLEKFCDSITDCSSRFPQLMLRWTVFFQLMKKRVQMFKPHMKPDPTPSPQQDVTLGHLWAGHTKSIETALPLFEEELSLMSKPEQNFGVGWANIVGFIAACHFETNFNNTTKQQKILLPPRVLHKGDNPPYIPDLTKSQNRGLELINIFYKTNKFTRGYALKLWQKAMCSPKGRADGRYLMDHLIQDPYVLGPSLIKLIIDFVRDHQC